MKNGMTGVLRQKIIQQAARLLAEGAEVDYFAAKIKAAKMLGYGGKEDLPANLEIDAELKKYQSIFYAESHPAVIQEKRREALSAMTCFEKFEPRLVGTVLEGTATENSPIEIHLFVDSLKDVTFFLMDNKIPYEMLDRKVRVNKHESKVIPVVCFAAGVHDIEMSIFPHKDIRQKYFSPTTGLTDSRASIKKVQQLLES